MKIFGFFAIVLQVQAQSDVEKLKALMSELGFQVPKRTYVPEEQFVARSPFGFARRSNIEDLAALKAYLDGQIDE